MRWACAHTPTRAEKPRAEARQPPLACEGALSSSLYDPPLRPPSAPPPPTAQLSADALHYVDFAASLADATRALPAPQPVVLATTFCILRKGHADYGHRGWLPGDHLRERPDRYHRMQLRHVTFKTFAWLCTRAVYEAMRADVGAKLGLGPRPLDGQPTPAAQPSLDGCAYCEEFCYDHYLEHRWRDASLVCPDVPRSRQLVLGRGGGMTERPGALEADENARRRSGTKLNGEVVYRWQYVDGAARQRARRLASWLPVWALPAVWALCCSPAARRGAAVGLVGNAGRSPGKRSE